MINTLLDVTAAILVVALFVSLYRFWLPRQRETDHRTNMMALFLLGLVVRIVALVAVEVWLRTSNGTPFLFGALGDDSRYHMAAADLAREWSLEGFRVPSVLYTRGFETALGLVYWVMSPTVLVGKAFNVLVGALIAPAVYRLANDLEGPRVAWTAGLLCALFPPLVFWSTLLYKDTLLTFALVSVLVSGLRFRESGFPSLPAVPLTIAAIGVVGALRLQSVLVVGTALAVLAIVRVQGQARTGIVRTMARLILPLAAVALVAWIFSSRQFAIGGPGVWQYLGLERINVFYEVRSAAFETSSTQVENTFLSVPIQLVATFFLPLPLFLNVGSEWAGSEEVMLGSDFVWLWLLFHAMVAIASGRKREFVVWLPVLIVIAGTAVGIATRGYAMIYRHKVQMYPFVIMLAASALVRTADRTWPRRPHAALLYWGGMGVLIVIYNYLRVSLVSR